VTNSVVLLVKFLFLILFAILEFASNLWEMTTMHHPQTTKATTNRQVGENQERNILSYYFLFRGGTNCNSTTVKAA